MYMSYCRHEGTLAELRACLADAEEHVNGEAEYEVSDREIDCFQNMVETFVDWLHDMDLLDDEGNLDRDALMDVCDSMKKTCETEEY